MGQIVATYSRTLKELLRLKIVLFWNVAWPILWLLLSGFVFVFSSAYALPSVRGSYTVSYIIFTFMIAGMATLPANIAEDRERGMLSKLKSMPVSPWRDFVGRLAAFSVFSVLAAVLVLLIGFAIGARFSVTVAGLGTPEISRLLMLAVGFPLEFSDYFMLAILSSTGISVINVASVILIGFTIGAQSTVSAFVVLQIVGLFLLAILASTGIGLIIGTLIKNIQGAIMTGVGIATLGAFISGLFIPYNYLPSVLQSFSRIFPLSSISSSIVYLVEGINTAGYNPLEVTQLALTIIVSLAIFIIGLVLYSKLCWRKE
nr:ABC transporter permease [Candidatus Freyarchaeota archaeon]